MSGKPALLIEAEADLDVERAARPEPQSGIRRLPANAGKSGPMALQLSEVPINLSARHDWTTVFRKAVE